MANITKKQAEKIGLEFEDSEKRHKCHYCGAVRFERKMKRLMPRETETVGQFGNDRKCWSCLNECWGDEKIRERPANLS